jgi:hypothetical protein
MSAIATCIMLGAVLGSILTAAIIAVSATIFRQECLSRRNPRRVEGEGKFDDQLNKGRYYHENQE